MRTVMIFNLLTLLLLGLLWAVVMAVLRRRKKSPAYLLLFTVFYVYLAAVLDYTLFQFQSLLLLRLIMPGLRLSGLGDDHALNLVPLVTLTSGDLKTSLLNVLLMVPFGFGLPFISDVRLGKTVAAGALLSLAIEVLQLVTGLVAGTTFRVADVNDLIFNTAGALVGYLLFVWFMRLYRRAFPDPKELKNHILRYVAERPQMSVSPDREL